MDKKRDKEFYEARKKRDKLYNQYYCPSNPAEFEHFFPTGKIIIANDLRPLIREGVNHNIDGFEGNINTTRDYARLGMAYYYVGNSCPGVWYDKNRGLVVGATAKDAYDCKGDDSNKGRLPYRSIGGVCTDLWWVSIMDEQDYFRLGGTEESLTDNRVDRATIESGRYVGRGFYGYKGYLEPNYHEYGKAGVMVAMVRSDEPIAYLWRSPISMLTEDLMNSPHIQNVNVYESQDNYKLDRVDVENIYDINDTDVRVLPSGMDIWVKKSFNFTDIINGNAYVRMINISDRMKAFYENPITFLNNGSDEDMDMAYRLMSGRRFVGYDTFESPFNNLLRYGTREKSDEDKTDLKELCREAMEYLR